MSRPVRRLALLRAARRPPAGRTGARPEPQRPPPAPEETVLVPPAVSEPIRDPRRSTVLTALLFTIGAGAAYILLRAVEQLQTVLVMVALSLLIALTLDPLVTLLQRGRLPRWAAALIAWLIAAVVLITPIVLAIRAASTQLPSLIESLPKLISQAEDHLGSLGQRLRNSGATAGTVSISPDKAITYVLHGGLVIFDAIGGIVIVGALSLWLLIALPVLTERFYALVPASHREGTRHVTEEVLGQVSRFMLTNVLTSVLAGAATWAWTWAFGIPYPLLLGSLVAILDLIPTVGSTIGGIIVTLVSLTVGVPTAIATLAFYVAFRLTEDYLIQPRAMRYSVELPGVVTVPAVLVGGAVLGIPGALFAVPVALVARVLIRDLAMPALDRR